ncbi:autotransporter outer membrane beta-barrel domain-containing protein, partial [SAR116 cluster bacterium]|nr:autotransporter outer membrane beta-barrel domain-containing protein [SAR116 cluster bacterium]
IVLRFYNPVNASLPLSMIIGTIGDDDRAGVTVSKENITLTENVIVGDEYTVVLTSQPTHTVTITPVVNSPHATVSGPLTFAPDRWNIPQTVFVKPVNDEIDNWKRQISQAMAENALSAVTKRIGSAAEDRNPAGDLTLAGQSSLHHALKSHQRAIDEGTLSLEDVLKGTSFVLPLNADGLKSVASGLAARNKSPEGKSPDEEMSSSGGSGPVLWGSGDYRKMSSRNKNSLDWKGEINGVHVGVDAQFRDDIMIGFMVSRSKGAFNYTDRSSETAVMGLYKSHMTSFYPYMSWFASDSLILWGTVGHGDGEIKLDNTGGAKTSSDTTMQTAAAGVNAKLISSDDLIAGGKTTLYLNSEASVARTKVQGAWLIDPSSANSRRVRMIAKGTHERQLSSTQSLTPSLEVGLRFDDGDGVAGFGLEVGGGLKYFDRSLGLTVAGSARVLAVHRDDNHDEWGGDLLINIDPNADGEGLSLSLAPSYGPSQTLPSKK